MTTATDPRDLLRDAMGAFAERLAAVDRAHLGAPTPCDDWSVRDLIAHVVDEQRWAPPLLAGERVDRIEARFDEDPLPDDPRAAWNECETRTRAALAADDVLTTDIQLPGGSMAAADYLRELFADHLIHSWDLARAVGADERLPDHLVAACSAWFDAREDSWRAQGAIGPAVAVGDDADAQTVLLARFGRDASSPAQPAT